MLSKLRALLILTIIATTSEAQLSVPAMSLPRDATNEMRPVVSLRLPADAVSRAITLARPSAAERAALSARPASVRGQALKNAKRRGLGIGFPRLVDAPDNALRLADLPWHRVDDGTRAARVALTSPGAVAIRVELAIEHAPAGLEMRFAGSRGNAPVFGPYSNLSRVGDTPFWSPVLEGETATIELALPADAEPGDAVLRMPMISHLGVPGAELKALDAYIGQAGACQTDVACLAPARRPSSSASRFHHSASPAGVGGAAAAQDPPPRRIP